MTTQTQLTDLTAWRGLERPVRIGHATPDTITVADLATEPGYERVTKAHTSPDITPRSLALSPLHLANWAITQLLVRPVFTDNLRIAAEPQQIGIVLDPGSDPSTMELWLSPQTRTVANPSPSAIGAAIGALLKPVADLVVRRSRIPRAAVTTVAAESAIAKLHQTARSTGHPNSAQWLEEASAAVAATFSATVGQERLHCHPDDGPAVVLPARSLCCVLHTTAAAACHSCPGCPKAGSVPERTRHVTEWLAAMDDDEFREIAGRPKRTTLPAPSQVLTLSPIL